MRKILIIILLIIYSPVYAEKYNPKWIEINKNNEMTVYVDENITLLEKFEANFDLLINYKFPQKTKDGKKYRSKLFMSDFKCDPNQARARIIYYYEKKAYGEKFELRGKTVKVDVIDINEIKWKTFEYPNVMFVAIEHACIGWREKMINWRKNSPDDDEMKDLIEKLTELNKKKSK